MKHLTIGQRYQISIYSTEKTQKEIAKIVGVSESSISRELSRNSKSDGSYEPQKAHSIARHRRKNKNATKLKGSLAKKIEKHIKEDYSPEQLRGYLLKEGLETVSIQGVYNYIWRNQEAGGDLYTHLRLGRKYRKTYGKIDKRTSKYANKPSIEARPKEVEEKTRMGDWEGDLVEGANKSGYLLTLTERLSKTVLIESLPHKTKENARKAIVKKLRKTKTVVGFRVT